MTAASTALDVERLTVRATGCGTPCGQPQRIWGNCRVRSTGLWTQRRAAGISPVGGCGQPRIACGLPARVLDRRAVCWLRSTARRELGAVVSFSVPSAKLSPKIDIITSPISRGAPVGSRRCRPHLRGSQRMLEDDARRLTVAIEERASPTSGRPSNSRGRTDESRTTSRAAPDTPTDRRLQLTDGQPSLEQQ